LIQLCLGTLLSTPINFLSYIGVEKSLHILIKLGPQLRIDNERMHINFLSVSEAEYP
jgi:hypothetical protein